VSSGHLLRNGLRKQVAQAEVDAGDREGVTTAVQEQVAQLRTENKKLRKQVEILSAATTFFAGALDSRKR
jgi:transposase